MSTELNPAEKRDGYAEVPHVAKESSTAKSTYYSPAPDPKALRDVSADPRAKMAGAKVSVDGHVDPVGVKAGVGGRDFDPAYEVVRDAIIANSIMPDEEKIAYDTSDGALRQVIERADRRANLRDADVEDVDSPARNVHADEIAVSTGYYTTGQNTDRLHRTMKLPTGYTGAAPGADHAGYPAFTSNGVEENQITSASNYNLTNLKRSNFRPHSLHIEIKNGALDKFSFVTKHYPVTTSPEYVEYTALTSVEGDRHVSDAYSKIQAMTASANVRTPFVKNMLDPLAILRLLRDVTLDTGAIMAITARTLNQAVAYQIFNQKAKTGGNAVANLQRMILDGVSDHDQDHEAIDSSDPAANVCSKDACLQGSVAAFVRPNLSQSRFSDHHTFLTYDGGITGYVKVLNSNLHNFYAHKGFIDALRESEVYSTVEGAVSPANPIWITDHHDVFSPVDWNEFCTFDSDVEVSRINESVASDHGLVSAVLARYTLDDNIQEYLGVGHPIVTGIFECLTSPTRKHKSGAAMLVDACGKATFSLDVPIEYSTMAPTFWQLLIAMSSDYIRSAQDAYLKALTQNPHAGINFEEFEPGAVKLDTANVFSSDSYVMQGWNHPIQPKAMTDVQRLRYCVPEDFSCGGAINTDGDALSDQNSVKFMPWYLMASDYKCGEYLTNTSMRNVDDSEPDQLHYPKYGIVGLKTDVVARAMANARADELQRAYNVLLDVPMTSKVRLLPYARNQYHVVQLAACFDSESGKVMYYDVWRMPRAGYAFIQMGGKPYASATYVDGKYTVTITSADDYDNIEAAPYTEVLSYTNVLPANKYGKVKPSGTLTSRRRYVHSLDTADTVRRYQKNGFFMTTVDADGCFWPINRSIVGNKFYDKVKGGRIAAVVGMLVEHPTFTYLGTRGNSGVYTTDGKIVDPLCEMYAAGLLVSVQEKALIKEFCDPDRYAVGAQ